MSDPARHDLVEALRALCHPDAEVFSDSERVYRFIVASRALLAALASEAADQVPADGWLDIASAPKDAEIVLVYDEEFGRCVAYWTTWFDNLAGQHREGWRTTRDWARLDSVTCWRPLPPHQIRRGRQMASDLIEDMVLYDALIRARENAREKDWPGDVATLQRAIGPVQNGAGLPDTLTTLRTALAEQCRLNEEMKAEAYRRGVEDAAKVAEDAGKPYALHTQTGAMMFRASTEKIAASIRSLPADKEGRDDPDSTSR